MCILDVLDNLPRLRISDSLMKMFIWAMRECGAKDVPSFYALRKLQRGLNSTQGIPNIECKSAQGKIFYVNDPRMIIANDWTNPNVRPLLHFYPEIPEDGIVCEVWHAEKWRTMDPELLSPMYDAGSGKHFYVFELLKLRDGSFVIPIRWIVKHKRIHAEAYGVRVDGNGIAHVDDTQLIMIDSAKFDLNYLDLEAQNLLPTTWSDEAIASGHPIRMPNSIREKVDGEPIYVSFIDYFGDDVSGNRSKSWNKHNNSYISHRNLPRKVLQQEFHVHLISTSQYATIPEQYHDVKKIIDKTRTDPVRIEDENGLGTRFILQPHAGPSDNPAQSEVASHIGSRGNHPCRKCSVGGTDQEKASNDGFHCMFEPGSARTQQSIQEELKHQVQLACRGVAKPIAECQTSTGTKDGYTQFWIEDLLRRFQSLKTADSSRTQADIENSLCTWADESSDKIYNSFAYTRGKQCFDPAKDTPVEILHTILLGVVKYVWHFSHTTWKPNQKELYSHRLQATDTHGLTINAIRANYIVSFANSLVGRQFKTVVQTAVFHLYDLVDENHFKAWKAIGALSALLWIPEIDDMDQYCESLEVAVANVQDMFAEIDPTKILRKAKIHLLGHIPEDTRRFGPLIGMATEVFESFNAVFRFCSVLSNHLAPSRDISRQTGSQESLKHRLSGGKAFNKAEAKWESVGPGTRSLLKAQPILQSILGWTDQKHSEPGMYRNSSSEAGSTVPRECKLDHTKAAQAVNFGTYEHVSSSLWMFCKSVVAESGDICTPETWVFYESPINVSEPTSIGRIHEILSNGLENLVVIEEFEIGVNLDKVFDLPYLFQRHGERSYIIAPSKAVLFNQNVQHDCRTAKCAATGVQNRKQERQDSSQVEFLIQHKSDNRFLLNLYAFHNAHLVRRTLPKQLTKPIPLFSDRRTQHNKNAEILRTTLFARKEQTRKKREEKQERKAEEEKQGAQSSRKRVHPAEEDEGEEAGALHRRVRNRVMDTN
ncbi:hypothetical protein GGU10DRAFT_277639 [Lentinula aff. detonsa]|uniref:Uncharacterized protein n=1 Tax=Lentinula aff. detonsa TaxID=2804958 RepID=A0AA38KX38_9AGAR|nr:hypothetical protein GGU10DRAFT_277639 [Lentinula aff. detonsa]